MKLFLTSNGIFTWLREQDRQELFALVGKSPQDIKVALIPTAGYPVIIQKYIEAAIAAFGELGMTVEVVDLKDHDERTLDEHLAAADVIYVNGGSSYWLLHWVRQSGFDTVIRRLLDQGKVYVGVSAGSIITGPDIREMTTSENTLGVDDASGLRLVEFGISPHYSTDYPMDLASRSTGIGYPVVALTDQQAVLISGDECRIVGDGPRVTFNGFKETA